MYAHPPRCSSTALPYTKQLKSRSYIFCFCWQLLTSHQRLVRHFGCFILFAIFLMALSFQSERHWIQPPRRSPITCSHPSRESTWELWSPCKFFFLLLSPQTNTPLETVCTIFLLKELNKNWQGRYFSFQILAVRVALVHWEEKCSPSYFTCCTHCLCWVGFSWQHGNTWIYTSLMLHYGIWASSSYSFCRTVPWESTIWPLTDYSCPLQVCHALK